MDNKTGEETQKQKNDSSELAVGVEPMVIIASYFGLKLRKHSNGEWQMLNQDKIDFAKTTYRNGSISYPIFFKPLDDSNQLDWLENEMCKRLGRTEITITDDGINNNYIVDHCYLRDNQNLHLRAHGETKNMARFNAIKKYVDLQL